MMTNQEYQEKIEGLANEIAYNLTETVIFQQIVLQEQLEQEVDIYYSQVEKISYNDLRYNTIQALESKEYEILDTTEFAMRIGQTIAEEIYLETETYTTSRERIENELNYYDYPDDIDREDIINEAINELINLGHTITDHDELLITPFEYHCTPNAIITPFDEDKHKNIKGLELEISDDNYEIEEILAKLAEKNIIATPNNWANELNIPNIALEEDGSVKYELIFRAQTNNNIIKEIEKIKKLETIVNNHTGTSAHIHINRAHIEEELGLTEIDIIKAAEFLNYPLFLISGRKKQTAHEWARSQLPCPIEANLATKAKHVDRLNKVNYAKYNFINCTQADTIELRIFSNKCNFDKNVINMYLETVDFIIELAKNMKNKSYTKELKNIIPLTKNHFEKFGDTLDFYNTKEQLINEFKEPKTLLKQAIKNEWITIDNEISRFMHHTQNNPKTYETIRKFISMIKTLNREYEYNYNFNINPETTDTQQLAIKIRREIKQNYETKMEAI